MPSFLFWTIQISQLLLIMWLLYMIYVVHVQKRMYIQLMRETQTVVTKLKAFGVFVDKKYPGWQRDES